MNLHRIDLVSLSLFNLVARKGSISQGAELAMLAVGAASKRVSDLEAAFGVPLLERHSRGSRSRQRVRRSTSMCNASWAMWSRWRPTCRTTPRA